ncbi:MAG: riboflavin synthase [Bacteroidales bacterium]|nr:riboflavin synthase [Bacteroidales bacterium]
MFTGIIEETGSVESVSRSGQTATFTIKGQVVLEDLKVGDSINSNGVCLTVTKFSDKSFCVDAIAETLNKTNLGNLKPGSIVNLERAMPLNGRFGGHVVSGHIDGTGTLTKITSEGNSNKYKVTVDHELLRYMIYKGSVSIDGVSLTISEIGDGFFSVSIIPHTLKETTLIEKRTGDLLNIECDLFGKYIHKFLAESKPDGSVETNIDMNFLTKYGYTD